MVLGWQCNRPSPDHFSGSVKLNDKSLILRDQELCCELSYVVPFPRFPRETLNFAYSSIVNYLISQNHMAHTMKAIVMLKQLESTT